MAEAFKHEHFCGWRNDGGHHVIAKSLPTFRRVRWGCCFHRISRPTRSCSTRHLRTCSGLIPAIPRSRSAIAFPSGTLMPTTWPNVSRSGSVSRPSMRRPIQSSSTARPGRRRMLGQSGDGCYGAAAVKAMTSIGEVSREQLGTDGTYSGDRAKAWGTNGIPADMVAKAAPFKLGSAALVSTWDELVAALGNGYPVTICTDQGFTMDRDPQGFRRPGNMGPLHVHRRRPVRPTRRLHHAELGR